MDAGSLSAELREGQRERLREKPGEKAWGTLVKAIGLMSGTSMDGIDIAYVETDGQDVVKCGPSDFAPYSDAERALLRAAMADAAALIGPSSKREERPGCLAEAEAMVTQRHAAVVAAFLERDDLADKPIDLIGFHGQTVLHRPEQGLTMQIGDGVALADTLGLPVAYDFRAADVAAGGEGAPLVPIFHQALARASGFAGPVLIVNIGGVANVTYVAPGEPLMACDVGPGNAQIDDLMRARCGLAMDPQGAFAARGVVDERILADLLAHPFFRARPPKSLDRNAFSSQAIENLSTEDAAATLTAFTAAGIASILPFLPKPPARAIVCGGGARNLVMMEVLRQKLGCAVESAEAFGWSVEAMEAQAFAYLAVRRRADLPISFPLTTGVARPLPGGFLALPGHDTNGHDR